MLGQLNGKRGAGLGFPINNYSTPAQLGLVTWLQDEYGRWRGPCATSGGVRTNWRCHALGKLPPLEGGRMTDPKRKESYDFQSCGGRQVAVRLSRRLCPRPRSNCSLIYTLRVRRRGSPPFDGSDSFILLLSGIFPPATPDQRNIKNITLIEGLKSLPKVTHTRM